MNWNIRRGVKTQVVLRIVRQQSIPCAIILHRSPVKKHKFEHKSPLKLSNWWNVAKFEPPTFHHFVFGTISYEISQEFFFSSFFLHWPQIYKYHTENQIYLGGFEESNLWSGRNVSRNFFRNNFQSLMLLVGKLQTRDKRFIISVQHWKLLLHNIN